VTFKKVQEVLSNDEIWREVTGEEEETLKDIRYLFKGMWGFEDIEAVRDVINDCKANPQGYVLKTQREGGGNNYYGNAILPILENEKELWQYSLMKRINAKSFQANLI
jgi:glutathione synthase